MAMDLWAYQNGVRMAFSRPGKPTDNAFVESFNGTFRAECLNAHWFTSLTEAQQIVETWRAEYNESRPHRALGEKTPHGIVVDSVTRHIYVNDRGNHRIQVFDENGNFLDQWSYGPESSLDFLYMSADRHIWASDSRTSKILEYDLEGHFLYAWGSFGDWPGAMWNVHQMSVDQEGNLYIAETAGGRTQKFHPRKSANLEFLVGQNGPLGVEMTHGDLLRLQADRTPRS